MPTISGRKTGITNDILVYAQKLGSVGYGVDMKVLALAPFLSMKWIL